MKKITSSWNLEVSTQRLIEEFAKKENMSSRNAAFERIVTEWKILRTFLLNNNSIHSIIALSPEQINELNTNKAPSSEDFIDNIFRDSINSTFDEMED